MIIVRLTIIALFISLAGSSFLASQQQFLPDGNWKTYLSHRSANWSVIQDDVVYTITTGGISAYNQIEESISTYSTVEGLSSINPTSIYKEAEAGRVFIGYEDGSINYDRSRCLAIHPSGDAVFVELVTLKSGGFETGGTNFDAKLRRQSLDAEDLIASHVGAMDVCARGMKAAAAMIEDGGLETALSERYSGWDTASAQAMLDSDFDTIFESVKSGNIVAEPRSGRQEKLENYVNRFV